MKIIEGKSEFVTFSDFEFIYFDLYLNAIKLRFLCIFIPPNISKLINIVLNMIDLIKHTTPKIFSFYIIGIFNFPNINWIIPSSNFNECNKSFIKFCCENFLTQIIDSPTHKDVGILDLVLCNYMGLDKIKSYTVDSPLTNTNDHFLISLDISINNSTKSAAVTLYLAFSRADFRCITNICQV